MKNLNNNSQILATPRQPYATAYTKVASIEINRYLSERNTKRSLKGSSSACLSNIRSASIMLAPPQSTWYITT